MASFAQNIDPEGDEASLPERILRIATALFASQGYAGTSIRQVVEAAGCTKPALYYHFENKEQLFLRAVDAARTKLDVIEELVSSRGPVLRRMFHGLQRLHEQVESDPDALRLLFRAELQQYDAQPEVDFRSFRAQHLERVQQMLREGIARGELREDLNVLDASIALVGTTHLYLQRWLDGAPFPADFAERIATLFLHGLGR